MEVVWITFEKPRSGLGLGVGVTGNDRADTEAIVQEIFGDQKVKEIKTIQSVEELEEDHVRMNMGNFLRRGVWYPNYSGVA